MNEANKHMSCRTAAHIEALRTSSAASIWITDGIGAAQNKKRMKENNQHMHGNQAGKHEVITRSGKHRCWGDIPAGCYIEC